MNEVTDNTNVNVLMLEELGQLRAENAALKEMVNELRAGVVKSIGWLLDVNPALCDELQEVIYKTPAQSLHDHDMVLAEKVREAVYKTGWCSSNIYDDDVLDLTAIARGESAVKE